jgi:hypothetical protein
VRLAIDHGDAARPDRQVVDVRFAVSGNPPAVEEADAGSVQVLLKASRSASFSLAALFPDFRAAGLVDHTREEGSQTTQRLASMLLAPLMPSLVLP